MKSVATGKAFDQVSLTDESGIFSLRNYVTTWMQPPPSTIYGAESQAGYAQPPGILDRLGRLSRLTPNTRLGTLRSTSVVHSRVIGLYLNERSARFLVELAGANGGSDTSRSEIRLLINFVTQWNDLIVLTERDLASLEELWTGKIRPEGETSASGQDATFYTLIEFASYISPTWEIVREIIYLAISKAAFDVLVETADYSKKHHGIHALPEIVRPCDDHILSDAINCLRSGSPSQTLLVAVACSAFALYSLPERQRSDHAPPTEDLGFGRIRHSRLRDIVSKVQRTAELAKPKKGRSVEGKITRKLLVAMRALEERNRIFLKYQDVNLVRITESRDDVSLEQPHEVSHCARCRRLSQATGAATQIREAGHVEFSANGMAIVESLNLNYNTHQAAHDVCLFATDEYKGIDDEKGLAGIIEDLIRTGNIYHTIRHPIPRQCYEHGYTTQVFWRDTIWNLPIPLRPPTDEQRRDILNWVSELRGEHISARREQSDELGHIWNKLQLSFCFLNRGLNWEEATQKADQYHSGNPHSHSGNRYSMYKEQDREEREARKAAGTYEDREAWGMTQEAPRFRIGNADIRNYHGAGNLG